MVYATSSVVIVGAVCVVAAITRVSPVVHREDFVSQLLYIDSYYRLEESIERHSWAMALQVYEHSTQACCNEWATNPLC